MAARKPRKPLITAEVKDRMNIAVAVVSTVVDALSLEEDTQDVAAVLLECALIPLRSVRDVLEAAK